MASNQEIAEKLRDMAVNTGTLNCLGCGFEHNCSVHGCAVLKQAAELILEGKFGYMIAIKKDETTAVPLEEVAGKLKTVDPKCGLIKEARMVGISFGDE